MGKYILKRIAYMLIVIWAVSLIAFVLLRAAPSDAAVLSLPDTATPEQIEAVREGFRKQIFRGFTEEEQKQFAWFNQRIAENTKLEAEEEEMA